MFPPSFGRRCSGAGHGALGILVERSTQKKNADDIAVSNDRNSACGRRSTGCYQQTKVGAALADEFLQVLGGTAQIVRRHRLAHRNVDAAKYGVIGVENANSRLPLSTTAITIDQLFFLASASAAAMAFMAASCPIGTP